jgi:ACS family hexuronate transporter-like MFS transporter
MLSDPVWFFYQNWYPKYLVSARGLTQSDLAITWVMFLAAGLGSVFGGWVSGRFIKGGRAPERVRLFTMLGCALVMPLSPLVALVPTPGLSLGIASIVVFAHLAWLVNLGALVLDVVPRPSLATVFGIIAAGSSLGAIGMNDLVAKLVKYYSYTNWFVIAACLHLAVIPLAMWGIMRRKSR